MNNLNEINAINCRTCGLPFENNRSVDLFKTIDMDKSGSEILQLSVMLELLTGLKFQANDEPKLGTRLCFECVREICQSYYFRQKCIETDEKMRATLPVPTVMHESQLVVNVPETCAMANDDFFWDDQDNWDCSGGSIEEDFFDDGLSDFDNSFSVASEQSSNKCKYCDKTYTTISFLKKHINSKHADLIKQNEIEFEYMCNVCGLNYTNYTNIRLHTKEKHPEYFKTRFKQEVKDNKYTYLCEFCGKGYKCPKVLKVHTRNHTGEKPYKCAVCDKNFTSEQFLRDHMRRHTDAKSLICPICDKGFSRKKYLDLHAKIHDDNKLYECHICSKRYVGRDRLVFHLRYHSRLNHQTGCPPISLNKSFIASLKPVALDDEDDSNAVLRPSGSTKTS